MFRLCRLHNIILKINDVPKRSLVSHINILHSRALSSSSTLRSKTQESNEEIYKGPLSTQIRVVKLFSLTSSLLGLIAQPIILSEADRIGSTSLLIVMCSVVGFFTFVTPLLLHFITKKYVTSMQYNCATSEFTATTISFFCTEKNLKFKPEDVYVPDVLGMFTSLHAKGKPLFVEARCFSDPTLYAKIMGYDKPMDFKFSDTQIEEKPK